METVKIGKITILSTRYGLDDRIDTKIYGLVSLMFQKDSDSFTDKFTIILTYHNILTI